MSERKNIGGIVGKLNLGISVKLNKKGLYYHETNTSPYLRESRLNPEDYRPSGEYLIKR